MVAYAHEDKIRHTRSAPCPICGGWDALERGRDVRCGGWTEGEYTFCQRPQYAGRAPYNARADVYRHRMSGNCLCGMMHGPAVMTGRPVRLPTPAPPVRKAAPREPRVIEHTYPYEDADGRTLFQVVRYRPKGFAQRRPDGAGGWTYDLQGVTPVLYRLPHLLAADPFAPVYVCEGEKDADALAALGLVATTAPMGAGKWRAGYGEVLSGRHVVVLPDSDEVGQAHGEQVAAALVGVAATVKVLRLPGLPDHGDVCDWLALGGTAAALGQWAAVWPEWKAATVQPPPEEPAGACRRSCSCCRWRRTVLRAATNPGSRGLLATALAVDTHLRAREHMGYSNERPFRVSSTYKAAGAGCTPKTYTATLKRLAEKGALHWQTRAVRPGEINPATGKSYGSFQTHAFVMVAGGADAFLERLAGLAPDPEPVTVARKERLGHCASCGQAHVVGLCLDCGEISEHEPDAGTATRRTAAALAAESPFQAAVAELTVYQAVEVTAHIRSEYLTQEVCVNTLPTGDTSLPVLTTAEQTDDDGCSAAGGGDGPRAASGSDAPAPEYRTRLPGAGGATGTDTG